MNTKEYKEKLARLYATCDQETKLAVTLEVFRQLVIHAREGGSFRYLIGDRLGFDIPEHYGLLYDAGGMLISNEFTLPVEPDPEIERDEDK